ncbi:MAG: hypothetical protein QXN15_04165 [Candidatus Jordarchaeales archaeon]|nr:hypothetical protein [Candidatus Jordarchaeia archaeon]
MIHNVYIMRRSGECLISRKYGSLEADDDLVTGFLSAILNFGEQIDGERVESIVMGNKKFVYTAMNDIIFIAYADKDDPVKESLELIGQKFMEKYGEALREWKGDKSIFEDFMKTMDEVLGEEGRGRDMKMDDVFEKLKKGAISATEASQQLVDFFLKKVKGSK